MKIIAKLLWMSGVLSAVFGCSSDTPVRDVGAGGMYFELQSDIRDLTESYGGIVCQGYMDGLCALLMQIKENPELSAGLTRSDNYYTVHCFESIDAAESPDMYDFLKWMEHNSTETFFDMVTDWIVNRKFDVDFNAIYNSHELLACEKISLIVMHNLIRSRQGDGCPAITREDSDDCYAYYDIAFRKCQSDAWLGVGVAVIEMMIPGFACASAITSAYTIATYWSCINAANESLELCLKKAKN